jgi:hypothetical protein
MTGSVVRVMHVLFGSARPLGGVILALAAGLVAYALRYGFIEPEALGAACASASLWWCAPRTLLIVATEWNLLGILALAAALLAWLPMLRWRSELAHAALVISGAGVVLYNASYCAAALVLAVLSLAFGRQDVA